MREVLTLTTTVTVKFDDAATVDYVKKVKAELQREFQTAYFKSKEIGDNQEYNSISIKHQLELVMEDYD